MHETEKALFYAKQGLFKQTKINQKWDELYTSGRLGKTGHFTGAFARA